MLNPKSPEGHTAWEYAQTIVNQLHGVIEAVQNGQGNDPISVRKIINITCDASGNGTQEIRIPRNAQWTLKKIAFAGTATGQVLTYVNEVQGYNLLKVNNSALLVTDTYDDDVLLEDDSLLIIACTAQTPNAVVSGNVRVLQYEANPNEPKNAVG